MQNRFYQLYDKDKHELDLLQQPVEDTDADVANLVTFLNHKKDEIQSLLIKCDVVDENFDAISTAIQECQHLKTFSLDYPGLTDDQLKDLANRISFNNLQSLSIKGDVLLDAGGGVATLLIACRLHPAVLKSLSLDGKNFGVTTVLRLATSLQYFMSNLESLHLAGDALKGDDLNNLVAACDFRTEQQNPLRLKSLSIAGELIGDLNAYHLARLISKLPDLVSIKIQGNQICDKDLECIVQAITGKRIKLMLNDGQSLETQVETPSLKNLKSLSIQSDKINEESINTLETFYESGNLKIHLKSSEGKSVIPSLANFCIFKIRKTFTDDLDLLAFLDDKAQKGCGAPTDVEMRILKIR